jgi:hypothetical protein
MKRKQNTIEQAISAPVSAPAPAPGAAEDDALLPLVNELYALMQSGEAPEGFDLESACQDEQFVMLLDEFGVPAAARIWAAETRAEEAEKNAMTRVNQQVQTRKGLPRPLSGGGFASPKPDYANMDEATFRKLSQELKRSARDGKRVQL